METPAYISNESKYKRGFIELKRLNQEVTEEALKALYIKNGGLIIGDPSTQLGVDEGEITPAVMTEEEKVELAKKPTKRRK